MAFLLFAKNTTSTVSRGDCIEARATGAPITAKELAAFSIVNVPNPLKDIQDYGQRWFFELDYSVLSSNPAQDRHTIRMSNPLANSTVDGITGKIRQRIENFLTNWNATSVAITQNQIDFDIDIYQAIISKRFWGDIPTDKLAAVTFTELNYQQGTGIHQIQADYSGTGYNPTFVERQAMRQGVDVISNNGSVLVFDAPRSAVRAKFLDDVKYGSRDTVHKFRWYVGGGVMNNIDTAGGSIDTDLATLQSYMRDKVAD